MAVSSDLKVTFTEFESAETTEGNVVTVPWNDFAEMVMEQGFFEVDLGGGSEEAKAQAKKSLPLIVPAEFSENTNRKTKENVERVWMGALDFDELEEEAFQEVVDRIAEEGLEAILYTTFGHAEAAPLFKFRVLIPFSRPVRKREWPLFWQMFNNLLGGFGDGQCKDPSRGYFAPGVPTGTGEEFKVIHRFEGGPLDINKLMSGVDTMSAVDLSDIEDTGKEHIDRERVMRFARKQVASKQEYVSWMGNRMMKMLKGEPFSDKGERDNTAYKMARDLGKAFPKGDSDSLASLFAQSLSQMGSDGPQVSDVREKIQRAQREEAVRSLKEEKAKLAVEQSFLEASGAPSDYDKAFVENFCNFTGNGCNFDLFKQRLIIQRSNRYYVFSVNTYWPYSKDELTNACRDLFKPAEGSLGANIYNVSDKGLETPKSAQQLVHDYGVVAKKEEIRMWANASYFEESTQTLVEAPYPKRKLEPKKHEAVDKWINDVCGSDPLREALRDWMALAPDLTRPLAMLVFVGKTGMGKTSFATGVSRLWTTTGYTKMKDAFGNFNTGLKKSPVLLADEEMPKDFRGNILTEEIRSLISSDQHQVNEKNRNLVLLRGHFRTVAALNNRDKLNFGSRHSKEDVEAIQARTLLITVQPNAHFDYELFVNEDAIAEHALYLQKERTVQDRRFGLAVKNSLVDHIQDSFADDVFEWIIWFVENRKLEDEKSIPAFVAKGNVYISPIGLAKFWTACHTDRKEIGQRAATQGLKLIASGEKVNVVTTMGVCRGYYCITKETLEAYALREDLDAQLLKLRLMKFTEQIADSPYIKVPKMYLPTPEDRKVMEFSERRLEKLLEEKISGTSAEEA